jgi:hypothetical protein
LAGGNSGGNNPPAPNVHEEVTPQDALGSSAPPPQVRPHDIDQILGSRLPKDVHQLAAAEHLILDMDAAGFRPDQILDPQIMQVAYQVATQPVSPGQVTVPSLATTAVAARVMGPKETTVDTVYTVQAMVDAGWNPNQIQRPDIYTAQAIVENGGYPTQAEVRKNRLDERFTPKPGAKLPPPIVGGNGNQGQP